MRDGDECACRHHRGKKKLGQYDVHCSQECWWEWEQSYRVNGEKVPGRTYMSDAKYKEYKKRYEK